MWSSDRRSFLLGGVAVLAGCGFTPAYGPAGGGSVLQGRVAVDAPKDWPGYLLVADLEQALGRTSAPVYGLSHAIDIYDDALSISDQDVTLRYNKVGTITYALRDLRTSQVVASGKVNSFTGYSASGTTVATVAAERDATRRLMQILSDQIVTRLIAVAPGLST